MKPAPFPLFPDASFRVSLHRAKASGPADREASEIGRVSRREDPEADSLLPTLSSSYLALPSLLFIGDAYAMTHYALSCATQWLLQDGAFLRVIDAGNAFNPYVIVRRAQRAGVPAEDWLRRVYVARAFTPYQTITLLKHLCDSVFHRASPICREGSLSCLPPSPASSPLFRESLLVLLPFDGLEDRGFSAHERAHLARKILGCVRVLAARHAGFFWVVERAPAPLLAPYFRALSQMVSPHIYGERARDRLLLRPGRAQAVPAPQEVTDG